MLSYVFVGNHFVLLEVVSYRKRKNFCSTIQILNNYRALAKHATVEYSSATKYSIIALNKLIKIRKTGELRSYKIIRTNLIPTNTIEAGATSPLSDEEDADVTMNDSLAKLIYSTLKLSPPLCSPYYQPRM